MGKMRGIALGLALMLGLGIISKKFKAGLGLGEVGVGITQLATGVTALGMAPFKAFGGGLGEMAVGIKSFSETLGDLGRGIGALLANIPGAGGYVGPGGAGSGQLPPPVRGPPTPGTGIQIYIPTLRPDDRIRMY